MVDRGDRGHELYVGAAATTLALSLVAPWSMLTILPVVAAQAGGLAV